jgi:hypothetical protein
MFKRTFITLFVVSGIFLSVPAQSSNYEVEDIGGRWGVGAHVSGHLPTSDEFHPAVYLGGSVIYGVPNKPFALTFDAGYFRNSAKAFNADLGELKGIPLIAGIQYRFPYMVGNSRAAFYGLLGAGIILYEFDESQVVLDATSTIEADDAFAFKVGAGWDIFFPDYENIALNIEASWILTTEDVVLTHKGLVGSTDEDTHYFLVGGGIRYFL